MKALLIDDERLARKELRKLLTAHPHIEVVGEAADAAEARQAVATLKPDLLFLDVQMPGEDGFALLESLDPPLPHVIFATAFDEFAVKAFEFNALDYLLKPVDPARLAAALTKLTAAPAAEEGAEPVTVRTDRLHAHDKVFVRQGEQCWFVEVRSIRLLESEGNYTRVHFDGAQPLLFRSLNAMEERLDQRMFFRANRRQLVNLEWIDKIEPWFSGGLLVHIKGGPRVELSRRQAQAFREQLSL
ncbi:MAG TPA: LytTR family DNA-binding domain-containing protein [Opitutaceae bacterium]|nr:LytTR family DNA-binding domain-containing protein [Opitutaceae bacterium]